MTTSPSKPPIHLHTSLPLALSKTTSTIAHINRLLSKTSTLDTSLLSLSYTLRLLHALLAKLPSLSTFSNPRSAPLTRLKTTLSPLTALLDETRLILRLWGLLGIYSWGASSYLTPSPSKPLKIITWAQIGACTVFQVLENMAFLAGRGVFNFGGGKRKEERVTKMWLWSGRAWMVYVGLELGRLGYAARCRMREEGSRDLSRRPRGEEPAGLDDAAAIEEKEKEEAGNENDNQDRERNDIRSKSGQHNIIPEQKDDGAGFHDALEVRQDNGDLLPCHPTSIPSLTSQAQIESREFWQKWNRDLTVNAAYAPMTVHYSLENGILSEGPIAALGVLVAWCSFGQAWRASA